MGFIGRNVQVFNEVRTIAYREVRSFKRNGATIELFCDRLERIAAGVNLEFAAPLPPRELRSTARSIAKWVWSRFSENRFSEIQSARGEKSGAARREKQAQVRDEIATYIAQLRSEVPREVLLSDMVHRHPLCNASAIARALNIPRKTVSDHLAAIREAAPTDDCPSQPAAQEAKAGRGEAKGHTKSSATSAVWVADATD